jgi:DNA (cytosine-5)-methyltransferase 1
MKHGSLFSGIGGFDLAAQWMGWENIFHCEIAEFPRKILNHYWPNADCYEDIKKTDFTKYRGTVDIISGGFPCQPYSAAGKRLGKEDDRHLWPEMLRVIREVKPQWVVGENVRGLLNWNGGMVFHEVCSDLENIGYKVQAFIIPASGLNAPHQRQRLWIVAHSTSNGYDDKSNKEYNGIWSNNKQPRTQLGRTFKGFGNESNATYTKSKSIYKQFPKNRETEDRHVNDISKNGNASYTDKQRGKINNWNRFPTQSPICSGDDGISYGLDDITFSKWRNESIKGYGNAVVPQVVYRIFKTIEYIQNLK